MSGSFWKFSNGFTSLSNISTLLENYSTKSDREALPRARGFDVLLKLLDENDLLQELLSNNSMLLEFLRDNDILGMLVDLVIQDGVIDDELSMELSTLQLKEKEGQDAELTEETDGDNSKRLGKSKHSSKEDEKEEQDVEGEDKDKEQNFDDENDDDEEEEEEDEDHEEEEQDDEEEFEEERATRRATLAAEILSADVWSLTDTVMDSTQNLNRLWSILDSKAPLSLSLSTYFMKIMEHLLDMKCDEMINYLVDNQPNLVEKFMNHLSNPPLMDFLLKLISTDKPDNSTGIIDFLQKQNLIPLLIDALDTSERTDEDPEILLVQQSSAADFLKALITISANSTTDNSTIGPNELTRELVSYEEIDRLCNIMLKGGYALANGVGIIIEIIRKNNSDYDILPVLYITLESHPPTSRDPIYLGHLLKVFGSKIDKFASLLTKKRDGEKLKTPFGEIEPLGFERFKICELIAELLHCSNMALLNDNKGFDVVKERDELRNKMKEFDPISFKYNEVITLPGDENKRDDNYANDTIDSFNANLQEDEEDSLIQNNQNIDEDEPHANANLTEEQIRSQPVIGDFLKIALYDTQIISTISSMFYKFPWNNFLHNVVFDIVQQVLNGSIDIGFNKFLAIDIFHLGDITNKIIAGQEMCNEYEKAHNGLRLGYMGHLTLIAEEVVKFIQIYPTNTLSELIDQKVQEESWQDYVNHILYDTREKYNAILGGGEEDEDEMSNTFDEGTGEIIDEAEFSSGLNLDPSVDHDITGSGFDESMPGASNDSDEDGDGEADENDENQREGEALNRFSSSDESESEDDDDHFSNYMSQQLTNTASTEIVSSVESPNEDDLGRNAHLPSFTSRGHNNHNDDNSINFNDDDGDYDEYIDPNDDGLSYKKSNPLYDSKGSLINIDDEISSGGSSSSSDDDDELRIDDENDEINKITSNNRLTRSASKSE
ncbi:uncharacterized protein PRCAT00004214001 [Priceomyces carsonii]|uniref:uncharacterized protein n=1 Tax=Priceomyces carsonii TaxID=28549 RepID=UPI002EDB93BA|nr:unnamed protein product [Priceomyces carsonii]